MSPPRDPNEPISERAAETALLRREIDRDTRERLRLVEARVDRLEHEMLQQLGALAAQMQKLMDFEQQQKPALDTLNTVVRSGLAIRWLVVGVVGFLAALATAATAWEVVKKWWH